MVSQNPPNHSPNLLRSYLEIHDTVLAGYIREGDFVGKEDVEVVPYSSRSRPGFLFKGEVGCIGEIVISMEKFLEITKDGPTPGNPWVETRWYNYHVFIRNWRSIFRYDNQDPEYMRSGHGDEHHKHMYNLDTGDEVNGSPIWIGANCWPHMHEIIEEAKQWYWDNYSLLPNPENYPELGVRG